MKVVAVCLLLLATTIAVSTGQSCKRLSPEIPFTATTTGNDLTSLRDSFGINVTGTTCFSFDLFTCSRTRILLLPVNRYDSATAHRFVLQRKNTAGKIIGYHKWCTMQNEDPEDVECTNAESKSMASSCSTQKTFWIWMSATGIVEFGNDCWDDVMWSKLGDEPFTLGDIVLSSDSTAHWTFDSSCLSDNSAVTTTAAMPNSTAATTTATSKSNITAATTMATSNITAGTTIAMPNATTPFTTLGHSYHTESHAPTSATTSSTHSTTTTNSSTVHSTHNYATQTGSWHSEATLTSTKTPATTTKSLPTSTQSSTMTHKSTSFSTAKTPKSTSLDETAQNQWTGNGSDTTKSTDAGQDGGTENGSSSGDDSDRTTTRQASDIDESSTKTLAGSNTAENNPASTFHSSSNVPRPLHSMILLVATVQILSVLIGRRPRGYFIM